MTRKYRFVFERLDGSRRKLATLVMGDDGSYYLPTPHHLAGRALIVKATMTYGHERMFVSYEDAIEVADLRNPDRELKLTHHTSGLVQFSGRGVLSGLDEDGQPRGIGVWSFPLGDVIISPTNVLTIAGVEEFEEPGARHGATECVFLERDFVEPSWNRLHLELHYFHPSQRRHVTRESDELIFRVIHPNGAVRRMRALFPEPKCALQNFFGAYLYCSEDGEATESSFYLSSAAGNARQNAEGDVVADSILTMFPRPDDVAVRRNLEYVQLPLDEGSSADS